MRKLFLLAFLLCAAPALAQQPAFRTVQSSQDPTGPLGLLTNLNGGQEIDLINAPTTASQSFAFYQTITNNVRQLVFSFGPTSFVVPSLGGGGTQCLQVSNTGAFTGTGAGCGGGAGITQLTGDVTAGPGSGSQAATLATVNANTGPFGSATQCVTVNHNAKGLATAVSATLCTPAIGSITGFGTGIAAALGNNTGSAGAPVLFNGAGGTPSSLALANATGLPIAGISATAWSTWTPSPTCGSGVFTVNTARFQQISKSIFWELDITLTTVGSCTTAFGWTGPATSQSAAAVTGRETVNSGNGIIGSVAASSTAFTASRLSGTATANDRYFFSGVFESQ